MIAGMRGTLELRGPDWAIIGVGGISFRVTMPTSSLAVLGNVGDQVRIHTHLYVREDVIALFGFATADELSLFEMLIAISGVGPKAALAIISAMDVDRLSLAVAAEDVDTLTRVPGIGKKMAGRLILELKGKLEVRQPVLSRRSVVGGDGDVMAALTALGYTPSEAALALSSLPDDPSLAVEEKIRRALRYFASGQ